MIDFLEERTIAKVSRRLVPFLMLCYFVAYLDRVNVGFAAITMNQDLGLSATAFGFGAGIFFFSYFIFEVPSNLALERFGARKWIARIMLSWGLLSGMMAAIPALARMTAGAPNPGSTSSACCWARRRRDSFPGIIFYLTLWFPSLYRARIVGYFMAAIPLSSVIGAPVSESAVVSAWRAWAVRLAVDVRSGGRSGDHTRRRRADLLDRPSERCGVA